MIMLSIIFKTLNMLNINTVVNYKLSIIVYIIYILFFLYCSGKFRPYFAEKLIPYTQTLFNYLFLISLIGYKVGIGWV